ncbi:MAG: FHA domain-containing protein [Lachnospiraceae bacterium]|nr:FHA domain-containing protein [Lachnospiraceae bacterium]
MKQSTNKIAMEIIKAILYIALGIIAGAIINSTITTLIKVLCVLGIVLIAALIAAMFIIMGNKKENKGTGRISNVESSARISRNMPLPENLVRDSARLASSNQAQQAQIQSNPLDRRPMSATKKEQHERNKTGAKKIVLINEEGQTLMEWSLERKTSLIIGKSADGEEVDIDLSGSAVAQMISKQHAVLNYTEKGWYVDDIDSKNGTRVKKLTQNSIMDVKLVGAIEVEAGDIIYIASTMLQIQ